MRWTFVTWSGASKDSYGPWIPIFRARKKVDSRVKVRVLALAAPNGVSVAKPPFEIQLRYLPTDRAVSQHEGEVGPLPARLDKNDVMNETVYAHSMPAAEQTAIDTNSPEGRGGLCEGAVFSVVLEASLRDDAPGRTLWMRVRHSAQDIEAPWGGSALLRIVVDESLEFSDGQERTFTLYPTTPFCAARRFTCSSNICDRCSITSSGRIGSRSGSPRREWTAADDDERRDRRGHRRHREHPGTQRHSRICISAGSGGHDDRSSPRRQARDDARSRPRLGERWRARAVPSFCGEDGLASLMAGTHGRRVGDLLSLRRR